MFTSELKANELTVADIENNILITNENLIETLKSLQNKTSTGLDKIPNIILKNLPINLIKQYCSIINN